MPFYFDVVHWNIILTKKLLSFLRGRFQLTHVVECQGNGFWPGCPGFWHRRSDWVLEQAFLTVSGVGDMYMYVIFFVQCIMYRCMHTYVHSHTYM